MALVESSRLWTTGGAGDGASTYTRDNMAEFFRNMLLADFTTQGVLNGLAVSGTASPLTLATGAACVYGFLHFCTTSGTMNAITTPAVGTTGLHVVLRADWTAQTVRVVAVRNTDGNSATPALTQTAGTTWEIRLATGTITTGGVIALTDARAFVSQPNRVFTAGRVVFASTGGALNDDANLTWDSTNHRLAINSGYATPLRGRQGGSATNWATTGTTNQTLTTPRVQCGAVNTTSGAGATITFPVAFAQVPLVIAMAIDATPAAKIATLESVTASAFSVWTFDAAGVAQNGAVYWIAIGQE